MAFNLRFYDHILPETRAEVIRIFTKYENFIPGWVNEVIVNVASGEGDGGIAAQVAVNYEYRNVVLEIFSCWTIQQPFLREQNIIHEISHMTVNPFYCQARRAVIASTAEDSAIREFALTELEKSVEAVTEDMAIAIWRQFNPDIERSFPSR